MPRVEITPSSPIAARMPDPAPGNTLLEVLGRSPRHHHLRRLLHRSGSEETLLGQGPLTVLAPTDDALAADKSLGRLSGPNNTLAFRHAWHRHVLIGRATPAALDTLAEKYTLFQVQTEGAPLVLAKTEQGWIADPQQTPKAFRIVETLPASNGVILVIEGPLLVAPAP